MLKLHLVSDGPPHSASESRTFYLPGRRGYHETLHTHSPHPSDSDISLPFYHNQRAHYTPFTSHAVHEHDVEQTFIHNSPAYIHPQQQDNDASPPKIDESPPLNTPTVSQYNTGMTLMEYFEAYGSYPYQQHNTYIPVERQSATHLPVHTLSQQEDYSTSSVHTTTVAHDLHTYNKNFENGLYCIAEKSYFPPVAPDLDHDIATIGTQFDEQMFNTHNIRGRAIECKAM